MFCTIRECRRSPGDCELVFYFKDITREEHTAEWIAIIDNNNPDGTPSTPGINDVKREWHFVEQDFNKDTMCPKCTPKAFLEQTSEEPSTSGMNRDLRFRQRTNEPAPEIPESQIIRPHVVRQTRQTLHVTFNLRKEYKTTWIVVLKNIMPDGTPCTPGQDDPTFQWFFKTEHFDEDSMCPNCTPSAFLEQRSKMPSKSTTDRYLRWKRWTNRSDPEIPATATQNISPDDERQTQQTLYVLFRQSLI